jgi:hypothetical protein
VVVAEVERRDGDGRTSTMFRSGSTMQVALGLRGGHASSSASVVLELRSQDGTTLFRSTTEVEMAADGRAELLFEVADLALLGGDYDLALGAAAAGERPSLGRAIRFAVAREPGAEGIIDLRGAWRTLAPARELS